MTGNDEGSNGYYVNFDATGNKVHDSTCIYAVPKLKTTGGWVPYETLPAADDAAGPHGARCKVCLG